MSGLSRALGVATLAILLTSSCSVKKYAIKQVGASLNEGSSVFESDPDVELVGEALPFSLKFVESLLAEVPEDRNLLITACRGFTLYSYAYVDFEADQVIEQDLAKGRQMRDRAHRLYMRAVGYGYRALNGLYPGIEETMQRDAAQAASMTNPNKADRDLPLLYWTAASLGLAISTATDDAAMLARLPEVEALLNRAIELEPGWDDGALQAFRVTFAASRPGPADRELIDRSYQRALELSGGRDAGLFVAYAEAVAIPDQNVDLFRDMINRALAIDPETTPENRLANNLAQRRARWLQERIGDLFLVLE